MTKPSIICTSPMLYAPVSPPMKNGKRWIDYSSVWRTAKEARRAIVGTWHGGWPDLRKRGWTIEKVIVAPAHPQEDQP